MRENESKGDREEGKERCWMCWTCHIVDGIISREPAVQSVKKRTPTVNWGSFFLTIDL